MSINKLYPLLLLPKTERYNKLQRVLPKLSVELSIFMSILVNVKLDKNKINPRYEYNTGSKHNIIAFINTYHQTLDINRAIDVLDSREFKVVEAVLVNNLFPTVELLGGIPKMYTTSEIDKFLLSYQDVPLFYQAHNKPFEYDIPLFPEVVVLNGVYFPYSPTLHDYLSKNTSISPELFNLPHKKPKVLGKFITTYYLNKYVTEYIDFNKGTVDALDWIVDDNYETIGVRFMFKDRQYQCKGKIPKNKGLMDIQVEVRYTKRGILKSSKLVID